MLYICTSTPVDIHEESFDNIYKYEPATNSLSFSFLVSLLKKKNCFYTHSRPSKTVRKDLLGLCTFFIHLIYSFIITCRDFWLLIAAAKSFLENIARDRRKTRLDRPTLDYRQPVRLHSPTRITSRDRERTNISANFSFPKWVAFSLAARVRSSQGQRLDCNFSWDLTFNFALRTVS